MPAIPDMEIRWMLNLFESLRPNKVWVVPRSNSVFQRQGDRLVFIEGTHDEYLACRFNFGKVGIEVVVAQ
jgi:hypothetical protein